MTRLLIIDDEPRLCHYLGKLCANQNFEVLSCLTSEEALAAASTNPPDILVTDWLLKEPTDGISVARELKKKNPNMRTIVISGLPLDEIKRQSASDDVYAFVSKPFDFADLVEIVNRAAQNEPVPVA